MSMAVNAYTVKHNITLIRLTHSPARLDINFRVVITVIQSESTLE